MILLFNGLKLYCSLAASHLFLQYIYYWLIQKEYYLACYRILLYFKEWIVVIKITTIIK